MFIAATGQSSPNESSAGSRAETSGSSPGAFTRLSLATKLLLLVLIPLAVVLGVTVALVINALGQLESDTSIARLQDEVAVISQEFAKMEADLELRALGLSNERATRLLPTSQGWLLSVVQRIDINGNVAGAVSVGRLLNDRALSELNFNRPDLLLVFFDAQGQANAVAESNVQKELVRSAANDRRLWTRANRGQTVVGTTNVEKTSL